MKRTSFRGMIAAGISAAVLFLAPPAKADFVTVDLGTVAYGVNVNATIVNSSAQNQLETYTYQTLVFGPDASTLNMLLDSHLTVGEVLAQDLGEPNPGTLDYNFPFALGASGAYTQNGTPGFPPNVGPGMLESLTATSVSGHVCTGSNNVGATISVDPTDPGATYDTILGCDALAVVSPGFPTSTTTTVHLTLGLITNGDHVMVIEGEDTTTTWDVGSETGPVAATPEPSLGWLEGVGLAAICAVRIHSRRSTTTRVCGA